MDLTPVQSQVAQALRPPRDGRPVWGQEFRVTWRRRLEEALSVDLGDHDADEPLVVHKHLLSSCLGCERRHLADQDEPFSWSAPRARGTIVHKAIELSRRWRVEHTPDEMVEEALATLAERDDTLGDFLAGLGEAQRAELSSECAAMVHAFCDVVPPLPRSWRPVVEQSRRVRLLDGRVVLTGRFDLMLGKPDGDTAGTAIIDLKTGRPRASDRDDLRWYSLLELLVIGVAPARVATVYLDEGRVEAEDVTADVIEAAARRVVGGVRRHLELTRDAAPPTLRPGPPCRWCPVRLDCEAGRDWLAAQDEPV